MHLEPISGSRIQLPEKVHFPIHGMSESNVKILKEAFGVAKRDF